MATPVKRKPSATLGQCRTYAKNSNPKRPTVVLEYIDEVYRLASKVGIDPVFVIAQSAYETGIVGLGPWESSLWYNDLNPAGIGMTDGGKQDYRVYKNGVDAARVHVVHVAGYVDPKAAWITESRYYLLDPRWNALVNSGMMGTVKNVEDFGSGKWATQDSKTYAGNILKIMSAIQAQADVTPTPGTGTIDNPDYYSKDAAKLLEEIPLVWVGTQNYHARGMNPVAIVNHITDDLNLSSTISWFQDPNSDASSHFVIDRDGTAYQFVSSLNAAWTNGDYCNPRYELGYPDLMRSRGGNWNNGSITKEHVAARGMGLTDAQFKTSVAIDQYFLHPDVYGKTIKRIRGFYIEHRDINSCSRDYCAGWAHGTFPLDKLAAASGVDMKTLK